MQISTFAAIEIGSYSINMEIFEISRKYGIRSIDQVRRRMELGKDSYGMGKIGKELVGELCQVLKDYCEIMKGYQVSGCRVCATSALREAENALMIQERVYQATGLAIDILSNSEQRFLGYKSIALRENDFHKIIEKGTAILDVGGGSIQISLFDKDTLVTTQNLKLGSLRVRERLAPLEASTTHYEELVGELIQNELNSFKKIHLKDRKIENVILVGDYFTDWIMARRFSHKSDLSRNVSRETFQKWYAEVIHKSPLELAMAMDVPLEYATLMVPAAIIYKRMIEELDAVTIWTPGTELTDGIAYDYAEKEQIIKPAHNFENDILMAARNIGKRYGVSKAHILHLDELAMKIFNSMKKIHGMGARERLLLQIAIHLHDCGKYISLSNYADCSYHIIMSTEIIGLSHRERNLIAHVVRFNTTRFAHYQELSQTSEISEADYLLIAKLTAILRLANALDRSHLQKITAMRAVVREEKLFLYLETNRDFTLEQGLLEDKLDFFEEVYNIRPILKLNRKQR